MTLLTGAGRRRVDAIVYCLPDPKLYRNIIE